MLAVGAAAGYWLYGDRLPSVLSRAASGAAGTVTTVATQASERLDRSDGARLLAERDTARRADERAVEARREQTIGWVPLPVPDAGPAVASARSPISRLSGRRSPAFVSLRAPELAPWLAASVAAALPRTANRRAIAIVQDSVLLRAEVELGDLAGDGPLRAVIGAALAGRDTLRVAGTLELVRPGLARYRVQAIRLRGVDLPPRLIPTLLSMLQRSMLSDSVTAVGAGALALPLPTVVADLRVANGKVTLYKAVRP